jgi:uncharacterized Fe-S cluster-containing radical SAM superfamily protein
VKKKKKKKKVGQFTFLFWSITYLNKEHIDNVDLQNNIVKVEVNGTPIAMDHKFATSFGSNSKLVMKKMH